MMATTLLLLTLAIDVATAIDPLFGRGSTTGLQSWQGHSKTVRASKARIVDILPSDPYEQHDEDLGETQVSTAEELVTSGESEFGLLSTSRSFESSPRKTTDIDSDDLQLFLSTNDIIANPHTTTTTAKKHPFLGSDIPKGKLRSTGTTIAGCVCEGNIVVLGADTRATADRIVADKRAEKIHKLAPGIYACGAGTSADLEHTTRLCRYSLELKRRQLITGNGGDDGHNDDHNPIITMSATVRFLKEHLMKGGGNIGANLIVGGQGSIVAIHPHGSIDVVPYTALGSGGLAAMAALEQGFRKDLSLEEAKGLVIRAVQSGIRNDLGSGSQVDLCILYPTGETIYQRGIVPEEEVANDDYSSSVSQEGVLSVDQDSKTVGVNGFGTMPFTVLNRRVRMQSATESDKVWQSIMFDSETDDNAG